MKSSKYWEDVALLREIAVQDGVTTSAEDILKLYDEALDDINREIKKIKANFMRRFGLDNETATYFLEAAQEEENLQMLINALEIAPNEKAREDILTYIHLDGLSVRAYAARTERYEAVKKSIYARIKKLAADETSLMTGMLKSAYKESYYGLIDDAAKGFDVGINFALLDDDAIEEAIKTKWHGKRFSERIWKNTDRLAEEAQSLVTKALMSGESLTKTAQKLADSFEVEKYHATTLVRTETAHAHAMADLKGYEDLGIEEYKYLATLDYMTCTLCQPLDGMVFKVSEAREGVNYPTLHPRCRCTTTVTGDFDKRSARNPITGKSELIDGNTTYTEWVKNMTPEQRQALELAKRKNERRTSDKLQHEKYKKLLGTKNVPKSFDKFQDLKYNNSELWDDLKKAFKYVNANPGADFNAYKCAEELKSVGIKGIIHIPKNNAIKVTELGFDDKHINVERNHKVTEEDAKQFINEAILSITKRNGLSENYYSKKGVSYVNPVENMIKTAFTKAEFKGDVEIIMEVLEKYGY